MARLDNSDNVKAPKKSKGKNTDVELAVRMTIKILKDSNGLKVISDAINQSKDPAQVIGQFLAQIMGQLAEKLNKEYDTDPRIFLSSGGWLEQVLDYIEQELGYPPEFSDQIYGQTLEVIKAAAMSGRNGKQPQQQGQQPQGQQPPQQGGGGMQQGGMMAPQQMGGGLGG